MYIISRKVTTSKSKQEVFQILKDSAYRFRTTKFSDSCFHIYFPTRQHKQLGLIPVKGAVEDKNGITEVKIEIHGGILFYVGMLFLLSGIIVLMRNFLTVSPNFFPGIVLLSIGVVIYIAELFDGVACLDSLEHRLTRRIE